MLVRAKNICLESVFKHNTDRLTSLQVDVYSTARGRNAFFWCRQGFFVTNKELQMIICVLFMYMCQCFMGKK